MHLTGGPPAALPGDAPADEGLVDCTVVIVTYNSATEIGGVLDGLPTAATRLRLRVLVVDNDSADDTAAVVSRYPDARFMPAGGNLGYAAAINLGRGHLAGSGALLVLNPDMRLAPHSIDRLIEALNEPGVGAAVPRILDRTGALYPSRRREPSLTRALGDALLGKHWPGRPHWLSEMVWAAEEYEHPVATDWATGAALAIRAEADRAVGEWDDVRFFLYSEETDYSRRLRDAGWTIRYTPHAVVTHHGGGSGEGPELFALNEVNRVRYYEKHHGRFAAGAFRLVVIVNSLLRYTRPASRRALRALVSRRRWSALPGRYP